MRQFQMVDCSRGAPMGRANWLTKEGSSASSIPTEDRSIRLFKVNLDSGGYDDGGAYWGHGEPLWCATDDEDYREFVRATDRRAAQRKMGASPYGLPDRLLKVKN